MAAKRWTDEEIEYLEENYGKIPAKEIAKKLGRGKAGVYSKAEALELDGNRGHWAGDKRVGAWTDEEVEFLVDHYLELGAEECARQLGRTVAAVHGKVRQTDGGRPSIGPKVEWTEKELEFLRENYQTMAIDDLVQKLGRTKQAIYARGQMLGMQRYIDPAPFFETWTEESAYVVGFFAADGWVSKRGPESVRIGFGQKDDDILFSIKEAIGVGDVYVRQTGMHRYYIQSVAVYERLCEIFGADVQRKCHTLQWPDIPDEYARHFIRGAVDGDGSWHRRKQDDLWSFQYATSSEVFALALKREVERLTGISLNLGLNKINVWHVRCVGIKAVCLSDWLYRDATIALERKAALAQKMTKSAGICQSPSLTPKMRALFPHILSRYEVVEVGQ